MILVTSILKTQYKPTSILQPTDSREYFLAVAGADPVVSCIPNTGIVWNNSIHVHDNARHHEVLQLWANWTNSNIQINMFSNFILISLLHICKRDINIKFENRKYAYAIICVLKLNQIESLIINLWQELPKLWSKG